MSAKRTITLGDILDLLGRDSTEVSVRDLHNDESLTGNAKCKLWSTLEGMIVKGITPTEDGLDVWLKEVQDHEPEEAS